MISVWTIQKEGDLPEKLCNVLKERELGSSWSWNEVLCRDGMCFSPWISCLSIPDQCLAAGCSSHVRHSPCKWIALCKAQHFVLTLQPMTSSSPSLCWMKKGHSHFWSSPSQGRWWKSYLPKSFPTYLFQLAQQLHWCRCEQFNSFICGVLTMHQLNY